MKIRTQFISNSSSSSFVCSTNDYPDIKNLAINMIKIREWNDDQELIKKLKTLNLPDDVGVSFNSINYRTYIYKIGDYYFVTTCNNTYWQKDIETCDVPNEIYNLSEDDGWQSWSEFTFPTLYKFYYLEYDVIGRPLSLDECRDLKIPWFCYKCTEQMVEIGDYAVCPFCG